MRAVRLALVLLLTTATLVVIPGEGEATVPGDIGQIAFVSDVDHVSGEIYVRDFAGSSPTRLTNNTAYDALPIWSPDGTQIAFSQAGDIWVMDSDGSNQVNLTPMAGVGGSPADWSPDGTQILFSSDRDGDYDIWVMYADGSAPRQLSNEAGSDWAASWSPDGTTIALSRAASGESEIWLMNADGRNQRKITNTPGADTGGPVFSPDGTMIAYYAGVHPHYQIWIMRSDGAEPTPLAPAPGTFNASPAWAPNGSLIAFESDRDGDSDLWMIRPDGTGLGHLTNNPANERLPSWESVNRLPTAVDDEAQVRRGSSVQISVLANDSDPDHEALVVADITRMPGEGVVAIGSGGVLTYTHNGAQPPPGSPEPYSDSFDYKAEDLRHGTAQATVTVWISAGFDDVPPSSVFHDDIMWLASQGITRGCNPPDNTMFCPGQYVTRGQMAAFLVRALHYTAGAGADLFGDDNGSIFELDIDLLGTAGVTRGCNPPVNDRFCPDALVTRGQMAAFLARAFHLTSLGQVDLFDDDNGSIFELDIDKLGATGVSKGCNPPDNDRFCPDAYVTREQMAAFIKRAVDYIT